MENYDAGQTVKLSCRNVWKIYGDTSDSFLWTETATLMIRRHM